MLGARAEGWLRVLDEHRVVWRTLAHNVAQVSLGQREGRVKGRGKGTGMRGKGAGMIRITVFNKKSATGLSLGLGLRLVLG